MIPLIVPELWLPVAHVEEVEPAGINDTRSLANGQDAHRAARQPLVVRRRDASSRA